MTDDPHRKVLLGRAAGVAAALLAASFAVGPALAGNATLNLVLVLDGLRPDSITADETPNLWRLRQEGVNFLNRHPRQRNRDRDWHLWGSQRYLRQLALCSSGQSQPRLRQ
jgi:hypothetical protein